MKKTILSIFLFTFFLNSYSQDFYRVKESSYSQYEHGEWVEKKVSYPEEMYAIFDGKKIKITNNDESFFITYGQPEYNSYAKHRTSTWKAYDKKGENCSVIFKFPYDKSSNNIVLMIVYGDDRILFEYIIDYNDK